MDKNRRVVIRKLSSIALAIGLLLQVFSYDKVSAADLEAVSGPAITVKTENADSSKNYDVNVEWGNMQFVYDYAEPKWDTDTLRYSEATVEGWKASGFNGINNKVQVSNRSNAEITVDLVVNVSNWMLNESAGEDAVQAWFYDTNEHALQASRQITGLNSYEFEGRIYSLVLDSAEAVYNDEEQLVKAAGVRTKTAYFAFSGTPDTELATATEVGSISLIFTDTSN